MEPLGSHKAAQGAEGSASQAKGKGGKRPAADGHGPAALSVAGLAALPDTPAILKAVQKAQAAAGQTLQVGKAAAGEASTGKTSLAQRAAGGLPALGKAAAGQTAAAGQAALGRAAVGQTTAAGQGPVTPKAMQLAVREASNKPAAALQAAGAAACAAAALRPQDAKPHLDWAKKTLELAHIQKTVSEDKLSKAI